MLENMHGHNGLWNTYINRQTGNEGEPRGERDTGVQGGSLEPPGPLLTHLHAVYMPYSTCLPARLNPLAERTLFLPRLADADHVRCDERLRVRVPAQGLDPGVRGTRSLQSEPLYVEI